ncbi:MAG: hypothetical protein KDA96_12960, partial [Planctomycetaceae bacterium]|nr:hypothetical protein [Planctomycetaceae bacterium]
MDRIHHTRELLQLLNAADVADTVLAQMDPGTADKLRAQLMTDPSAVFRPRQQRLAIEEFERFFEFAIRNGIAQPVLHDPEAESENQETEPEDEVEEETVPEEPEAPAFEFTGDPLHDLGSLTPNQLAQALETEQPKTTAILVSHLPTEMAASALSHLTPDYRSLVVRELSREQHAPAVLVERIARATLNRGQTISTTPPDRRDHSDRLADVLRSIPKAFRSPMLATIEEEDEDLSKLLLKKMYRFEDLTAMEGRMVQRVLGEVDSSTLTNAMFGIAPEAA